MSMDVLIKPTVKLNIFDKVLFLYVIVASGAALGVVRSQLGMFVLLFLSLAALLGHNMLPRRSFYIALTVWMLYFIGSTLAIGSFHPYFMLEIPILMLSAYALINIFGVSLFWYFSRTIYILAIISLFFYAVHWVAPGPLRSFINAFDFQGGIFDREWRNCASIVIYTIAELAGESFPRNCGFCWEPGAYSCYLVLALFFNYFIIRNHAAKTNLVLMLALLTTFSTTGYILFGLMVVCYVAGHRNMVIRFSTIFLVLLSIILFFQLDFLGEKVDNQLKMVDDWSLLIENSRLYGGSYAPSRFISLKLAWINFLERPIFGYAGRVTLEYSARQGANVAVISGIGYIIARYGICGLLLYLTGVISSGLFFIRLRPEYGKLLLLLWVIMNITISVSYRLMFYPFLFTVLIMGFFLSSKQQEQMFFSGTAADADSEKTSADHAGANDPERNLLYRSGNQL